MFSEVNRNIAPSCTCHDGYIEDIDYTCISETGCKKEIGRS